MKSLYFFISLLLLCFFSFNTVGYAKSESPFYPTLPPWTPVKAMEWAYEAYDYIMSTGDFTEFQKKDGQFTKGLVLDYRFVWIADCESDTVISHSFFPHLVGKKGLLTKQKDVRGMLLHRVSCQLINQYPDGIWMESYQNVPQTKLARSMLGFAIKVKGTPYFIAVLTRDMKFSEQELNNMARKWLHQRWKNKNASLAKQLKRSTLETIKLAHSATR